MFTCKENAACAAVLAFFLATMAGDYVSGPQTRGRVRNNGTTIVTDWGTPLRGGCWGLDICSCVFTREEVVAAKNCGINAIHVYCELTTSYSTKPIGYAAEYMDSIVTWCREESLYVVITHGGAIRMTPLEKIYDIWRFYAPRYANETHVIYEPKNEPGQAEAVAIAKETYRIIREAAPETHILFLSYSNIKPGPSLILNTIEQIGDAVDWSNASVAYHGYGTTGAFQEAAIKTINEAGYAMTCTEWPVGADLFAAYERAGISYFHFEACWPGARTLGSICNHLKKFNVTWQPDFGEWPQPHVEHPEVVSAGNWARQMNHPGAATVGLFSFNSLPQRDICALYDVTGRMVWHRPEGQGSVFDRRSLRFPPWVGTQLLLVKYGPY
jgi:hypothetical protein